MYDNHFNKQTHSVWQSLQLEPMKRQRKGLGVSEFWTKQHRHHGCTTLCWDSRLNAINTDPCVILTQSNWMKSWVWMQATVTLPLPAGSCTTQFSSRVLAASLSNQGQLCPKTISKRRKNGVKKWRQIGRILRLCHETHNCYLAKTY